MIAREVQPEDTLELRRTVLRGGRPVALPGDGSPAFHIGIFVADVLAGTGSVRIDPAPWLPDLPAWRLRGMATDVAFRSQGVGALVLESLFAHARAEGGGLLWCNARERAIPFYARNGLQTRGEIFREEGIGPHIQMWRDL